MSPQEELYISIEQQSSKIPQIQLFDKSCFKINRKAFICFFQNEMLFKLKEDYHS